MNKILLLTPLSDYTDDILLCNSFNSVMTFFIKKYLEKLGNHCKVVAVEDAFTIKRVTKSNYTTFKRLVEDPGLLNKYDTVIVLGIKSLRSCDQRIIDLLKTKGKKRVLELDETGKRVHTDFTCIFMIPEVDTSDTKFIGQGVDLDYLYSEKSDTTLVVHVDHPWPTRAEYFDQIQEKLQELVKSQIYKNYGFTDLEIIYHTVPVTDVASINNTLVPPNVSFPELAEIYRKVHVGFISHAETMGNYPLELAATGATVVLPNAKGVPSSVMALTKHYIIDIENFWDTVLTNLDSTNKENLERAKAFSYECVAKRIIKILGE